MLESLKNFSRFDSLPVDVRKNPTPDLEWHAVMVLCSDRAVGCGWVLGSRDEVGLPALPTGTTVAIYNAVSCYRWAEQKHASGAEGVYALATLGPAPGSTLGKPVAKVQPNCIARLVPIIDASVLERWYK